MNRDDFPILQRQVKGNKLIYLDSAATALTPLPVTMAMQQYYEKFNANVHRGSSTLGQEATDAYENARNVIAKFIGSTREETLFTKNCTEALNMAANIACERLQPGDEILIPISEHHSNFVVWQQIALQKNLKFRTIPINKEGKITLELLEKYVQPNTKLVAFAHISNVLGILQPVMEITRFLHKKNIMVVVDGSQGIVHEPVNVKNLEVDFYAFSAHKVLGPTGIGVLYAKKDLLQEGTPQLYGGEMIQNVSVEHTTWNDLPWKFEAGTPPIAEAIGLATALLYYQNEHDPEYLNQLTAYTRTKLEQVPGLELYGTAREKTSVFAFTVEGVHAMDLAQFLDGKGIQLREGHHCAQPLLKHLGVSSLARISLLGYNTTQEIDTCIEELKKATEKLKQ